MVLIRFAGDPRGYDYANTISHVVRDWLRDDITEADMLALLRSFKSMRTRGIGSVRFLKDINSNVMMETSLWFSTYGVEPFGNR